MMRILFFPLLLFGTISYGQQSLDEFRADQVGDAVRLKFTLTLGAQCTGVQIFRGVDTLAVEEIGEIAGVCGSASAPVTYYYTDESPEFNKTVYYRLNMGVLGYSHFIGIKALRYNDQKILAYPNPVTTLLNLNIRKPYSSPVELQMINVRGEISSVFYYTAGDAITADVGQLPRGIYYLKVVVDNEVAGTEKIILQ